MFCRVLTTCCELLIIQKQLTPVFLKIPSQYSLKWVITSDKQPVKSLDSGLVVQIFEAAINLLP